MTHFIQTKAGITINESDISDVFQSIHSTIKSNMQKSLGKGSGSTIDSIIDYNIGFQNIYLQLEAIISNCPKN